MSAERLKRIHPMIESHVDAKDYSGAVTLVARKGKIVHFEAHGMADTENNKPMKTDTLFRLMSMTKPFTAVSILMLMEEGKLVMNDPVSKFIPEYKDPKVAVWYEPSDPRGAGLHLVPATREITLQDLLTHTSGLANGLKGRRGIMCGGPICRAAGRSPNASSAWLRCRSISSRGPTGNTARRLDSIPWAAWWKW